VRIRFLDMLPRGSAISKLRRELLASARTTLLADEQRFGSYGAPELDIVQTPTIDAAGMEYPEIVFVEMTDSSAGADSWPKTAALTAHEIAHQWFYSLVGDNQWREPFLDESFATFVSGSPSHPCKPGHPLAGYPTSVRLTSTMGFFDHHPSGDYYGGLYGGGACALRDLRSGVRVGSPEAAVPDLEVPASDQGDECRPCCRHETFPPASTGASGREHLSTLGSGRSRPSKVSNRHGWLFPAEAHSRGGGVSSTALRRLRVMPSAALRAGLLGLFEAASGSTPSRSET